jgi:hypothetical protein
MEKKKQEVQSYWNSKEAQKKKSSSPEINYWPHIG